MARRIVFFLYGAVCYLLFLVAFLYAIGFTGNLLVPKGIDEGAISDWKISVLINVGLLSLFALQHTIMARPAFKQRWTKIVPQPIERSTFVLLTSLLLMLLYWQWRPIPDHVWDVGKSPLMWVVWGVFALGWLIVLIATFLIDHFELFGLKQVWYYLKNEPLPTNTFKTKFLYRFTRHPLMLGFIVAFWAAPVMSLGHLLYAIVTTAYILVAIQIEERDLISAIGEDYRDYRKRVSMLIPLPPKKVASEASES